MQDQLYNDMKGHSVDGIEVNWVLTLIFGN